MIHPFSNTMCINYPMVINPTIYPLTKSPPATKILLLLCITETTNRDKDSSGQRRECKHMLRQENLIIITAFSILNTWRRRMAHQMFGNIEPFDQRNDNWNEYVERVEQLLIANEIAEATKKVAILLTVIGSDTYTLLRNVIHPDKPSNKTFQELVEAMRKTPKSTTHCHCRETQVLCEKTTGRRDT